MNTTTASRPTTSLSPAQISAMLAQRRERAKAEAGNYGLFRQDNGVYSVVSRKDGTVYEATQYACTCPDFNRLGKELGACKHVFMVRTAEEDRLTEIQRERVKEARRVMELDYEPFDEFDKPARRPSLIHPLEDERAYEAWLSTVAELGDCYPAD